jgi:hypothetical protein
MRALATISTGLIALGTVAALASGCAAVDEDPASGAASAVAPLSIEYANDAQGVRASLVVDSRTLTADVSSTSSGAMTATLRDDAGATLASWIADPTAGISVTVDGQTFTWGVPTASGATGDSAPPPELAALASTPTGQALHALGLAAMETYPAGADETVRNEILFLATPAGASVLDSGATAGEGTTGQSTDGSRGCRSHWTVCGTCYWNGSSVVSNCTVFCMPACYAVGHFTRTCQL